VPSPGEAGGSAGERPPALVRHFGLVMAGGIAVTGVLVMLSAAVGTTRVSPADVVAALVGHPVSELHRQVVLELRLPRALVAVVAGGCLGLAGALSQAVTRNPLASPDLTGVAAGVVFCTVSWIASGPTLGATPDQLLLQPTVVIVGGVGGAGTGWVVYALSARRRGDPVALVLTGVVVALLLGTATAFVLMLSPTSATLSAYYWFVGSLNARAWAHWAVLWPWAAITVCAALVGSSRANVLQLGDDVATGLGVDPERTRLGLFLISAVMTAGALVVVGAIAFVGLIAPHVARGLVGHDLRRVQPLSFVIGAALLCGGDLAARSVAQRPLPTGVVTAVLGAGFFMFLLLRRPVPGPSA
jgi:iron complex transport system permease protein